MAGSQRRNLATLILVSLVLRLAWAASLETGQDEAYHFLYTVHPDWSYFDHPPMLMYIAKAGIVACGGWLHPLSVRLGFVLLFTGSTLVMYFWTSRYYGERAGFYSALALNLAAYYAAAAGAFVLPDGPLLFFALLTMWALSEAMIGSPGQTFSKNGSDPLSSLDLERPKTTHQGSDPFFGQTPPGRLVPWIWVGLACAGAMLSKYHAVFLPLGTLAYVLFTPSARRNLLTPGPYLAAAIGFLGLVPVLIWNSRHDWASFAFQSARAVGLQFRPKGLAVMLFGPMALLFPWIWVPLVGILTTRIPRLRTLSGNDRLLVFLSILPLCLFGVVSCFRPILPHWPLMGFLPLFPLLGATWAERSEREPVAVRRWLIFMFTMLVCIAGGFLTQARFGLVNFPFRDPCTEISGWESVGTELQARGLIDRPNTFLFTNRWYASGQLAFATRNRIDVACYNPGDARGFAFWSKPEDWVGKDGVFIDEDSHSDAGVNYKDFFREIQPLPPIQMTRSGRPFRTVKAYLCIDQTRPFPFTYPPRHNPK
jgi:4-amino-4-deoxy-L-arabinose transferase-like glycosyltransferase